MKIVRTAQGALVHLGPEAFLLPGFDWDSLFHLDEPIEELTRRVAGLQPYTGPVAPLAPIAHQEVWAAGVTYFRSRDARMDEAKQSGGADFYARVYEAERPELFFKATAHRVVGPGAGVGIRRDSRWNVPEPELTLVVNRAGRIIGYTIGNDMSSRDIEGENPLYLPQAKVYDRSCALGPCLLLSEHALPPSTEIRLAIARDGQQAVTAATTLERLKRKPAELVEYLYRECSFPDGCFLLTGTGIVPPDDFTLRAGDRIAITIPPIGTLENTVL